MLAALHAMTAGWQAIFYVLAIAAFLVAAFGQKYITTKVNLVALGLAFFAFPLFWNALALSTH